MDKNVTVKQVVLRLVCLCGILSFIGCSDAAKEKPTVLYEVKDITENQPEVANTDSVFKEEKISQRVRSRTSKTSPDITILDKPEQYSSSAVREDFRVYQNTDTYTSESPYYNDNERAESASGYASEYWDDGYYHHEVYPGYYDESPPLYFNDYYSYSYYNYYYPSYIVGGYSGSFSDGHSKDKRPVLHSGNVNEGGGRLSNPIGRKTDRVPEQSGNRKSDRKNSVENSTVLSRVTDRGQSNSVGITHETSSSRKEVNREGGRQQTAVPEARTSGNRSSNLSVQRDREERERKETEERSALQEREEIAARYYREAQEKKEREERENRERAQREAQEQRNREEQSRREQQREEEYRRQREEQDRRDQEQRESRAREERAAQERRQREEQEQRNREEQARREQEQREAESRRQREEQDRRSREAERSRQQEQVGSSQSQSRTINRSQSAGRSSSSGSSSRSSGGRSGR